MKTKIWKSSTVPYSIWATFIFVLATFIELQSQFIQYMYLYYFILTFLTIIKVEFEVVPQVNEELRFYNNLKEVPVTDVMQESGILTARINGKKVFFDTRVCVANYKPTHLHFSKVFDQTRTSSLYILVHEWHLAGFINQYRVYEKTPVTHPEDK